MTSTSTTARQDDARQIGCEVATAANYESVNTEPAQEDPPAARSAHYLNLATMFDNSTPAYPYTTMSPAQNQLQTDITGFAGQILVNSEATVTDGQGGSAQVPVYR